MEIKIKLVVSKTVISCSLMIVYLKNKQNTTLFSARPTVDRSGVWTSPCSYQGKERYDPQNPAAGQNGLTQREMPLLIVWTRSSSGLATYHPSDKFLPELVFFVELGCNYGMRL